MKFGTLMIILASIVAAGWIAYGIWRTVEAKRDKTRPKKTTEHLRQVQKSFDSYISKVEKYERKPYKPQQK